MSYTHFFGVLSTLMTLFSRANYLHSIYKGKTRPHAFTWFIWGTISSIGFAAQVAEGAGAGSWARGLGAASSFVIVAIALFRKGRQKNITRSDWVMLLTALSAIPLWMATKTPVWSVIIVCAIDTLGYVPTLRKSWASPTEEAATSYAFSGISAVFALLAIEHYTVSTWLYSAVLAVTNMCMVSYLLWRRHRLRSKH